MFLSVLQLSSSEQLCLGLDSSPSPVSRCIQPKGTWAMLCHRTAPAAHLESPVFAPSHRFNSNLSHPLQCKGLCAWPGGFFPGKAAPKLLLKPSLSLARMHAIFLLPLVLGWVTCRLSAACGVDPVVVGTTSVEPRPFPLAEDLSDSDH